MSRRFRIAIGCSLAVCAVALIASWSAYRAARHVRPFYQEAIELEPAALEQGRQEMETRASTLYSDVRSSGRWQAMFTADQINGWLAGGLATGDSSEPNIAESVRQPRVAISSGVLTLGFTTTRGGVETVVSVDAAVFLTAEGEVAVRLEKMRAGSLPLPTAMVADDIAVACARLRYPVLWMDHDGAPTAIIQIGRAESDDAPRFAIDTILLTAGELYVAGHTEFPNAKNRMFGGGRPRTSDRDRAQSAH